VTSPKTNRGSGHLGNALLVGLLGIGIVALGLWGPEALTRAAVRGLGLENELLRGNAAAELAAAPLGEATLRT
jgi:hypothetical protein